MSKKHKVYRKKQRDIEDARLKGNILLYTVIL